MAYEYEVDGKVYKLQTMDIYSRSSGAYIPIYAFREYLMEGWEFLPFLPDNKTVVINKRTRQPFVISKIKVTPIPRPDENR